MEPLPSPLALPADSFIQQRVKSESMRTEENVNMMAFPGHAPPSAQGTLAMAPPRSPWIPQAPPPAPEEKPDIDVMDEVDSWEKESKKRDENKSTTFDSIAENKPLKRARTELKGPNKNPWHVNSVFDFQYFNCPECKCKTKGKQEFVNHASRCHPWGMDILKKVEDGSLDDIDIPNTSNAHFEITSIKNEPIEDYYANDADYYDDDNVEPMYEFATEMKEEQEELEPIKVEHPGEYKKREYNKRKKYKEDDDREDEFPCKTCGEGFKSRYSLKSHKLSEHGEGKGFQCTICPAKFTISGNLKNHIAAVHEGLKPFNCTLCDYKCNKRDSLKKHMNTHVKDRVKPFECPREGCDTRFFTAFAQKKHVASKHDGIKPYSCHACPKRFTSKTALDYHVTLKHDPQGKTYDETTNPEEIKDNPVLMDILKRKAAALKQSSCKLCDKQVFRKGEHIKKEHTDADGMLECPKCHIKLNNYREAYCHVMDVHNKVPCTECGEMVGKKSMFNHMQRKHGYRTPEKKHICTYCGKGFPYENQLKDHTNTHTGAKPYLCKFCGQGFASFGNHRNHEKAHMGIKRNKDKGGSRQEPRRQEPQGGHQDGRGLPPPAHANEDSSQGAYQLPTQVPYQAFLNKKLPIPGIQHRY